MEVITKYRANDGQEFESKELCLAHEKATKTALNAMKIIQSNCQSFFINDGLCVGCPFAFENDYDEPCCRILDREYPKNWEVPD